MNGDSMGPSFIPSSIYSGSKHGYYFGTGAQGTGYYVDHKSSCEPRKSTSTGNNKKLLSKELPAAEHQQPLVKKARFDMTQNQTMTIPNRLLEQAEQEQQTIKSVVVDLSAKGLATATLQLSKCMTRNELERAQQQDQQDNNYQVSSDPSQFMAGEVALYEHIVALKSLAAAASDLYGLIASSNSSSEQDLLAMLCQLLLHPNPDISTSVVSVLLEWMDPNLLEDANAMPGTLQLARRILLEATDALVDSLDRLNPTKADNAGATAGNENEDDEDDVGKGTEDILSLLENLLEMELVAAASADESITRLAPEGESVASYLCRHTRVFSWLFQQVNSSLEAAEISSLQGRAMELLANLAPREEIYSVVPDWSKISTTLSVETNANVIEDDTTAAKSERNADGDGDEKKDYLDGIEIILQIIAGYKKKQPKNETQLEFLENACIVMASALTYSTSNVKTFLECQGIELVIRCLKERVHAGGVALKWLDFATGKEPVHRQACEHLVSAGALKYLFPLLMARSLPKQALETSKKEKKEWQLSLEATTIRILYGLIRHLQDDSPNDAKARFLAKFMDDEKCDRLVELCISYDQKARMAEFRFYKSEAEDELEDDQAVQLAALDAKLEGGGELYHRLAAILAFCCVESRQSHERVLAQLHLHQSGIGLIGDALEEFCSVLDEGQQKEQLQRYLKELL